MLTLTQAAAGKVKELLDEEGRSDIALRASRGEIRVEQS